MNIVQIGTNKSYDSLTKIIYSYPPSKITNLIMVEPFELHNNSIINCYKDYSNLYIENIVISPTIDHDYTTKIWYNSEDLNHSNPAELASLNQYHSINIRSNYDKNNICYIDYITLNINELFNKYSLKKIDILYVDTEGFDDQIIYTIDFNKYIIHYIYYENLHINKNQLQKYLIAQNYIIQNNIELDPYSDLAVLQNYENFI